MSENWYESQVQNRNYLSPIGFLFVLEKARKISYLCQSTSIPTLSVGAIDIPTPGMGFQCVWMVMHNFKILKLNF